MGPPGQPNDRRVGVITAHRPAVISNPRCGVNDVADEELLQAFELRVDALSEACLRRGPVQTPSSLMFFEFRVSRRTQFSYMYTTQDSHCTKASGRRVRDHRRSARLSILIDGFRYRPIMHILRGVPAWGNCSSSRWRTCG